MPVRLPLQLLSSFQGKRELGRSYHLCRPAHHTLNRSQLSIARSSYLEDTHTLSVIYKFVIRIKLWRCYPSYYILFCVKRSKIVCYSNLFMIIERHMNDKDAAVCHYRN